jgi:DNA-binding NtrC family response regulator
MTDPVTVLVADDEPLLRDLVQRLLEREGFRVCAASEPDQALGLLGSTPEIAVALLDMRMFPNGEATLRTIRARHPRTGLILASGALPSRSLQETLEACGGTFLKKPFPPQALVQLLREMLPPADRRTAPTPTR